jgi:hypothetical protein
MSRVERLAMVARGRADLSVRRRGALLGLARSGVYRTANIAGCRRNRGDAVDRPALSGDTVLWLATNDGGVARGRPSGQPQAGAAADASHGARSPRSKAKDQSAGAASPDLSLLAAWPDDRPVEPSRSPGRGPPTSLILRWFAGFSIWSW